VFRISGQDAEELAKEFDATPPPPDIIGQRPILTPKRDVIEHLLQNGHSNPAYSKGAVVLELLTEQAGTPINRPQLRHTDNLILAFQQYRVRKQYVQAAQMQADLKALIQSLNIFFYEVMRDRNPYKPFNQQDIITLLKFVELDFVVKAAPQVIPLLCSADSAQVQQGVTYLYQIIGDSKQRQEQLQVLLLMGNALRILVQVLAADPIMANSGQHEPIYDKPRAYADVQNQIATDLANLKPFHAKCKLGNTEELLKSSVLPPGIHDGVIEYLYAAVQKTTQLRYCKSRSEVEEEIRTRQEKLTEPEAKKRTTKEEETI
jgi:hypothetical protein